MKIVDREGLPDFPHLWAAEVTTPQGIWRTPQPMPFREIREMLLSMGLDKDEIGKAETKGYVEHAESIYRGVEKNIYRS